MELFTRHDDNTAPEKAADVLGAIKQRYGFIPNLAAYLAESPTALGAVLKLAEAFDNSSFTPQEQQLVLLTISTLNGCGYCKTAHTALGKMNDMSNSLLQDIIAFRPLADPRLQALREFTRSVVEDRGWIDEGKVRQFLDAGFDRAQVFEVVLGIALKTFTNFSNHIAGAEPNQEFIDMAADALAA